MRLKDKVAMVSGASRGIGRGIALRFAEEGCNLVINYLQNEQAAEEVEKRAAKAGAEVLKIKADVSNRQEVQAMFSSSYGAFGRLDIIVNNAGFLQQKPFEEITDADWDKMLSICLKAPFIVSQEALTYFKKQKSGRIINIASMGGQFGGPKAPHYAAAKAGLICFTKSTARIMAEYGVTCNAISPGFIKTEMSEREIEKIGGETAASKSIPSGRIGRPEDIAAAAVYLASDEASFVTGHVLNVNGGQYML